jgi:uridine kinase
MGSAEIRAVNSGGPFAQGLRRVIQDVKLGSLLIQSDPKTGEPLLFYTSLPESIKKREQAKNTVVFLLDAQVRRHAGYLH